MKKIVILISTLLLALSLTACGNTGNDPATTENGAGENISTGEDVPSDVSAEDIIDSGSEDTAETGTTAALNSFDVTDERIIAYDNTGVIPAQYTYFLTDGYISEIYVAYTYPTEEEATAAVDTITVSEEGALYKSIEASGTYVTCICSDETMTQYASMTKQDMLDMIGYTEEADVAYTGESDEADGYYGTLVDNGDEVIWTGEEVDGTATYSYIFENDVLVSVTVALDYGDVTVAESEFATIDPAEGFCTSATLDGSVITRLIDGSSLAMNYTEGTTKADILAIYATN